MLNIKQTIDGRNKAILRINDPSNKTLSNGCNCESRDKCVRANATINDNKPDQTYVGRTSNTFKTRFADHETSYTNVKKK